MDRIDPLYYIRSSRIDVKEETRINATSDEAAEWEKQNQSPGCTFVTLVTYTGSLTLRSYATQFHF